MRSAPIANENERRKIQKKISLTDIKIILFYFCIHKEIKISFSSLNE